MSINIHQNGNITYNVRGGLRSEVQVVHDWYSFVLSFPPRLVQDYLKIFEVNSSKTILDPFCGTGTTLVECKKRGFASIGIESNPMTHFASTVKVDWSEDGQMLLEYANEVVESAHKALGEIVDFSVLPLFKTQNTLRPPLRRLRDDQSKLLLKNSISPIPLHKTLVLLDAIDEHGTPHLRQYGRLALANALVKRVGNLKFGPEVGVGTIKDDAPVFDTWFDRVGKIAQDISIVREQAHISAEVYQADSREADNTLKPGSVDVVITSPPYPNEKDYTRTTRLESVILGLIRDKKGLRSLKQKLIRSNTRNVYKSDTDDLEVSGHAEIQRLSDAIERRRLELGKTSGFERLYPRVTQLYFGGMYKHLSSLRPALRPGAKLAYVVGDQASYLRVMIHTGQIIADLARSLGYRLTGIDLFRTRMSTVTGNRLREEVVLLEWPGS